jgi:voltage-gated potassium channel
MKSSAKRHSSHLIRSETDRRTVLLRTNIVLLLALILFIFIIPVIPEKGHYFTRILLCIVVVSGLYAADFSKIAFRILSGLGAVVILVTLLNLIMPEARRLTILAFLLNTCFFVMVTIALVAHVARARNVYGSTILCAVNSYLLLGLTMSILFLILDLLIPGSFSQVDSQSGMSSDFIYFGFVTLTTLGYGDITPSTLLSRSMSIFTALVGQLYLVIIMALIIGKFLSAKEAPD